MRTFLSVLFMIALVAACASAQQQPAPDYKIVEVTHFTGAEGVELTPDFYDFLYAELKSEFQKKKLFDQIIGEGEVVEPSDAASALTIGGTLEEYKKGSVAKAVLIGFGTGRRSLRSHVKVVRMSDKQALLDKGMTVKFDPRWDNKQLARQLARKIAGELKEALKQGQ